MNTCDTSVTMEMEMYHEHIPLTKHRVYLLSNETNNLRNINQHISWKINFRREKKSQNVYISKPITKA